MDIDQSLERILSSQESLGELFYETFLTRYPEVKKYFEGINLERQAVLLTMAAVVIAQYYSNPYPATKKYLRYLGSKHHDRNIPTELYPKWTEAMLATLKEFHGDDWDNHLAEQWTEAIAVAAERMFEGYQEHFNV